MKYFCFLFILFFLIGCQSPRNEQIKKAFTDTGCIQCHTVTFQTSQAVSNDWHFAHLWNPAMVVTASAMPRYNDQFELIPASISAEQITTQSGETVCPLIKSDDLRSLFSFDKTPLIYLYLSNVTSPDLPEGYKAFTTARKMKGTPVIWLPPELRAVFRPPAAMTIITPKKNLQILTDYVETLPHPSAPAWLAMPDPPGEPLPQGKPLYEARCASCHGEKGDGNGPSSIFLFPKPRNFQSGEFKLKSTLNTPIASDSDVYRTITHGMPGTAMPSWSFLSREERWALVEYVKSFATIQNKNLSTIPEPKLSYRPVKTRLARGEQLFFTKAKCNDCHGPSAKSPDNLPHGDGPSAGALVDDWGYPIHPADLAGGTLKRGNSVNDIYLTITSGMPGTPMPPYQNNLSDEERWNIAVYVSALNKGQAHHGR